MLSIGPDDFLRKLKRFSPNGVSFHCRLTTRVFEDDVAPTSAMVGVRIFAGRLGSARLWIKWRVLFGHP